MNIPIQDVLNVSDSEAESVLNVIKAIVPDINKGTELVVQKKDVFAQLHNIFSIEGLFVVPDFVGYTIIRLISAQIEGLHAGVSTLGNILIQLSPVCNKHVLFYGWHKLRLVPPTQPKHKEEATNLKSQVDAQFQQTLKAYS